MICGNCFKEFDEELGVCPYCGEIVSKVESHYLQPGTKLNGTYIIGKVLGQGGFGCTYKAYDINLDRVVAIKENFPKDFVARDAQSSEVYLYNTSKEAKNTYHHLTSSFLNEARSVAMLKESKNVVNVLNYFEENNTAYMVMEFLEGETLNSLLKRTEANTNDYFPIDRAIEITNEVLEALKVVHGAGIIHRDIKPANIFITKEGVVKLIDFGTARIANDEVEMYRTKVLSFPYAPPEQHVQRSRQAAFTDIYALGAVLYQMLTYRKLSNALDRQAHDDTVDPHTVRAEVPERLSNVVMRAIALKPELRFQSADEFQQALIGDKEIRSVEGEMHARMMKRLGISTLIICLLIVGGIGGYVYYQASSRVFDVYKTSINVAVPIPQGMKKKTYQKQFENYMLKDFRKEYKQVSVDVRYISSKKYPAYIKKAIKTKQAPDLFDSSSLTKADMKYCGEINYVESVIHKSYSYYFLDDTISNYKYRLPTLFTMPVIYQNYEENVGNPKIITSFKSLSSAYLMDYNNLATYQLALSEKTHLTHIKDDQGALVKRVKKNMLAYGYKQNNDQKISTLFKNSSKPLDYYLTDSNHISGISAQYRFCTIHSSSLYGKFHHFYSLSTYSNDKKKRAACRLMINFLGPTAQNYLSNIRAEGMPINKDVLDQKKQYLARFETADFINIKKTISHLHFLADFDNSLDKANQSYKRALKNAIKK